MSLGRTRICLTPRLQGVGGMVSFQHKLAAGLAQRGVEVTYDPLDLPYSALLVIGGTHRLADLWRLRRKGVRIVQRLDGMNWMHRALLRKTPSRLSLRYYLRSEYGNWILATIRRRLAGAIVYQSQFSCRWWENRYGATHQAHTVIYNGVDLQTFTPSDPTGRPDDRWRVLLVEGSLRGGYEFGLEAAVGLARALAERLAHSGESMPVRGVELVVAGRVDEALRAQWERRAAQVNRLELRWAGLVPHESIPALDRSAHLLYSGDLNPACPNAVIEALACGLPVVAYDTGALPELVSPPAGRVVPFGGDPWALDPPDLQGLAEAAMEILAGQDRFRAGARRRAQEKFGLDDMVNRYMEVLLGS